MTSPYLSRPAVLRLLLAAAVATAAAACNGPPDLDEPALVAAEPTEKGAARAAAVGDMRARAAAAEYLDYPDVFADPAVYPPEPLAVRDVVATQEQLVGVARKRNAAYSPADIAAGQARAAQLRRLAQARAAEAERLILASGAPQ